MAKSKTAFITGITGQDGSYLAEFLLDQGYKVFGLEHTSSKNDKNIKHLEGRINLVPGDLLDEASLVQALKKVRPDEVYNLAAQSFVMESWRNPIYTGSVTGLGALRMLEAVRQTNPGIKFYQASTSEMFGDVKKSPQNEQTPFFPRNPYGLAKLYAHWMTKNYREFYGMFAVSGIMFNHESPRRGFEVVTRKISNGAAKIKLGLAGELRLGDLEAKRDWGFSGDYVQGMWKMLQQEEPKDFVFGTGETHSVREFVEEAFGYLGLDWRKYVKFDEKLARPSEVSELRADASLVRKELGWKPKVSFRELVRMMVDHDLRLCSN